MTTASDIIAQAFREANIVPIGQTPTPNEQAEALPRLNNFIAWLFGTKLGELSWDWPIPPQRTAPVAARYPLRPENNALPSDVWPYPPNNVRLLAGNDTAETIYLPFSPNPGARIAVLNVGSTAPVTLNANGRFIEDAPSVVVTPATDAPREWFYREDIGSWRRVTVLALTDESILPAVYDDLLVCALAIRLAPRFGQQALPETISTYESSLQRMKQVYKQYMPVGGGFDPVLMSRQAHGGIGWTDDEGSLYGART